MRDDSTCASNSVDLCVQFDSSNSVDLKLAREPWPKDTPHDIALRRFARSDRPQLFKDSPASSEWPAFRTWSPHTLAERLNGSMPLVDETQDQTTFMWYDETRQMHRVLGLRSTLEHPRLDNVSSSSFFLGKDVPLGTYRQMSASLAKPPISMLSADVEPRAWMHATGDARYSDDVGATLWAGDGGTASHAHYDGTLNCFVQVHGRKEFLLWPPDAWREMRLHPQAHPAHRQAQAMFPAAASDSDDVGTSSLEVRRRPLQAFLTPGDMLLVPPFWFHQVRSVTRSVAVSVWSKPPPGTRFDRACRVGVPSALLAREATREARAHAAQRFLGAVLSATLSPPEAAGYALSAITHLRHRPQLAQALHCDDGFGEHCDADGRATEEERAYAAAVSRVLRGVDDAAAGDQPDDQRAVDAGGMLDGVGHIVLQDYVEHVAGFAVGMRALCGFISRCL